MKNRIYLIALLQFLISFSLSAQLPEKALEIPIKYINPEDEISLSSDTRTRPGSYWVVWSDRNDNTTYAGPSLGQQKKRINFMEPFYVAAETDEMVQLIKDEYYFEKFSSRAEDYGWIEKTKVLLWDHCLVTKQGKINKKGMILNTVESLKKDKIAAGDEETVKFYYDQSLTQKTDKSSRVYEVLYVYKITDNAVLLGKPYATDVYKAKNDILGWVDRKKITIWDHRIALEPNWEPSAVDERKSRNLSNLFLIDETRAKRYAETGDVPQKFVIWEQSPAISKRPIGDWRRFPLLEIEKQTGIVKAGVMGELRSVMGKTDTMSTISFAQIQRKYNEMRAKSRNINIVFVVDGTKSMEPYFSPISKAITESMSDLMASYTKNTLRFGAVVYTDVAEGDHLTQVKPLGSNYNEISKWMSPQRVYHQNDTDTPEAMYYGLMTALRSVGFQQNETNVIILVGDAGNHKRDDHTQIEPDMLVNLMELYGINMLAFQVHNESHASYDEFEYQVKYLIQKTATNIYNATKEIRRIASFNVSPPEFNSVNDRNYVMDTSTMIGTLMLARKNDQLAPYLLQQEIKSTVKLSNELTNKNLDVLERFIASGESFEEVMSDSEANRLNESTGALSAKSSFAPAIVDFLRRMDIPEDKLKILLSENYQLYFPAYSTMKVNGMQNPLYRQVLFLTQRELGEMLDQFDNLADAYTTSSQRQRLKEVWLEILQKHLGDDYSREQAEQLTFEQINEKVFGLPGTSNLLHYNLRDLTDPSVVSDTKFYTYVTDIKNKRNELNKIYNDNTYEYGFYSYDEHYFWISQDLLP
jgi:hypothetical protein